MHVDTFENIGTARHEEVLQIQRYSPLQFSQFVFEQCGVKRTTLVIVLYAFGQ